MTTESAAREAEEARGSAVSEAEARDHVQTVVAKAGSSFTLPMWLLPKQRRQAMFAVYAFCREVDDIADEPAPEAEKRARLAEWRAEIERIYENRPVRATARALVRPAAAYGLRKEDFLALIDGMETDAGAAIRGPAMAELELYCARVAGAVGRLSVGVFGATEAAADDVARELGQALQLTNILRDLQEDAERGRLYLPDELLEKHGIESRDPAAVLAHPALGLVCGDLAQIARKRFANAAEALAKCARRPMRPAYAMMEVYRRILDRLEARGWQRLDRRVGLSLAEKLWIAVRHMLL